MPDGKKVNKPGYVEMFFSIPNHVLRLCQFLDDTDLLVLSQVSSSLNKLALQTFFISHGMILSQFTGMFSVSSLSLPAFRLAIFIPSLKITKLSCVFDVSTALSDMRALQRVLSRLPPIPEFSVSVIRSKQYITQLWRSEPFSCIDVSTAPSDMRALQCVLSGLPPIPKLSAIRPGWYISQSRWSEPNSTFADLLSARNPYKNFLFLSNARCAVSMHHRVVHPYWLAVGMFPIRISPYDPLSAIFWAPARCAFWLVQRLLDLAAAALDTLSDPRMLTFRNERVRDDVEMFCASPRATEMRIIPLPNSLSLTKWTMVTFNEFAMVALCINHIAFLDAEKRHSICPVYNFPVSRS